MTLQPLVRSLKVEGVGTPGQSLRTTRGRAYFAVGFFVVTAFIFAVIIHALGVGLKCPGGPPGGSLAVAAVVGHRRCRVVLRVAGARRDDLWPFLVEMVGGYDGYVMLYISQQQSAAGSTTRTANCEATTWPSASA